MMVVSKASPLKPAFEHLSEGDRISKVYVKNLTGLELKFDIYITTLSNTVKERVLMIDVLGMEQSEL